LAALPPSVEARLRALPKGLRDHVARTRALAVELARLHGADERAADLAAAGHDLARALKPDVLLSEAHRLGLPIGPVEQHTPILLHGPIAAAWLVADAAVDDRRVLEAVRWHTTGRVGMDAVEKVVFVADKAEPWKVKREPWLRRVSELGQEDLDKAILEYLDKQIAGLLGEGRLVHPRALELRNDLVIKLRPRR
jgi:predicted HD superfamily hydrolase involved in NAD metabolism